MAGAPAPVQQPGRSAGASAALGRADRWALPAILALAALNFGWQLGSSGFYVDEVLSVQHSLPSLSGVLSAVRMSETTPWTFFVFLHEWLYRTGSQTEWVVRLPSAIAGVALVGAVYWMARAFVERRPALLAAALCALSPLVLEYAQQVRVYVFVMLAATVAVGATVRAAEASTGRSRMLAFGAVAAVLSLWLHYTAALVIAPLCVWLATRVEIPRRWRAAFVGVCLVAAVAVLPLLIDQYHNAPNGGLVGVANLTWANVARIAATPFDSRVPGGVDVIRLIGVAAVLASAFVLVLRGRERVRSGRLLAALGVCAPLVLIAIGIAGKDVVITRYTAVAAPFMLTAIAAAVTLLPRPPAATLLIATLVVSAVGLAASHQRTGYYAPAREAIAYIRTRLAPADVILTPGPPGDDVPLDYYGQRLLDPLPEFIASTDTGRVAAALAERRRVWLITQIAGGNLSNTALLKSASLLLGARGYRALSVHTFTTTATFAVVLAVPASTR